MAYGMMPQPNSYPNYTQPQQSSSNPAGLLWVNSDEEAANHIVLPNCVVTMWNRNEPVVYLKQADAMGRMSMEIYDLVKREPKVTSKADSSMSTEDADSINKRLNILAEKVDRLWADLKGDEAK